MIENSVIKPHPKICAVWKDVEIIHGKPRHSQIQSSVERVNQDAQNMLIAWLNDNDKKMVR